MALNPITFTERVVDDFLHYQLTTYPLADPDLYDQLRALLKLEETRRTPLRKGPYVSLSRPFRQGSSVQQLVAEGVFHPQMAGVASYTELRAHQEEAIRDIHSGRNVVMSTGTGSGKTEAFLYPIISRCLELQEAGTPPGVLAVIVYPMNALAEDQLERIRGLLAGRGIPFGMYIGKTPQQESQVRGERLPVGSTNAAYRERLKQIREAGQALTLIPPEERASREAMRADGGQPRILLTNVKQLELLLTRGRDVGIFARAPLEFLVFDEAHTFRGAQGAETACLVRRLRTFCGRQADDVRHVATSATMADPSGSPDPAKDFARSFFGVDGDSVTLVREVYDELRWNERRSVPPGPPEQPLVVLSALLRAVDASDDEVADAISAQLVELGGARLARGQWQGSLASQLASNELVFQIAQALSTPRALNELSELLGERIGRPVPEAEILSWLALGAATGRGGHDPLLRPVVHTFVRGVGGAVATFSGPNASARLWLSGEDADHELGEDYRRFPIITCTTCGQHYHETFAQDFGLLTGTRSGPTGGDLLGNVRLWEHLPEESGGARALFVDRLVVRPDEGEDMDADELQDGEEAPLPTGHDFDHGRLHPMFVCSHCGSLHESELKACAACNVQGALVPVQVVRTKEDLPGVLHSCVACQAPGKRPMGGRYREPARPIRAVGVSDVHVLAQSMVHLSERPRLLVFADNRQDAAFQSGWMRDHARRFRFRALMVQQIPEEGTSVGDVVYSLDEILENDRELSRALVPEVWQVVPFDDSGTKHREERLYFLRIQVLRELATGVKQRIGLEPWGRLKVAYQGLSEDLPFVVKWAPVLDVTSEALVEGIGALLDHLRRTRLLHDENTEVFEKWWNRGDKEVQYGYLPEFPGGPKGMKLSRGANDEPGRVTQWIGSRPTQIWNAVKDWGVPAEDLEDFLSELWRSLVDAELLVAVSLTGWGRPLTGAAGVHQIDSTKVTLHRHTGRYRCEKCRRTTLRRSPTGLCIAWRCGGRAVWEDESEDDFNLRVLDGDYDMLRVAEHSAQVPHAVRERIENQFKGEGEQLNVLVCTPTLELGVDIGALDAVLMRNVPPTPANYWQRVGRAGRRHRMAVDVTYAQSTGFDQAYFREPLKLLGGMVEPPRINLKNEVMIRKHVHATVLTALHGIAREVEPEQRRQIEEVLTRCFPPTLRSYLFSANGHILDNVLDVSELGTLIGQHRSTVEATVLRAFKESWPSEDAAAVDGELLARVIEEMPDELAAVLGRFKRRLDWARGELRRLSKIKHETGGLDPEDKAHERRCEKVIGRLKGTHARARGAAQGGPDDSETMGALAREGFLPGYGLESGSLIGTAEPPRMTKGLDDFDLPRPPTLALREYVPGNAIYANGFRFVPRRFLLTPEETLRFRVVVEQQVVQEVGTDAATAPLAEQELRAVPVCDVILPSQSQISDEEEFRFQMPVATYGNDRGYHRGGTAWHWSDLDLRFRRGVQLRIVNVGPRREVQQTRLGFPLCLACGQSLSPFASKRAREEFDKSHLDRCDHVVQPTGFFADVEVDVLGLHDVEDRKVGFSVMEALRLGAARVLDMEAEDLQLMALGRVGEESCDVMLYDPMPGGSGLLEHLVERWDEVRSAALELLLKCPGACEASCVDCLQTYRNRFYHEHLDRHIAAEVLASASGGLSEAYPIPEKLPSTQSTTGQSQTWIEARFHEFLRAAGLPGPLCQHPVDLGPGYGRTIPDFFYGGDEDGERGVCIYLDGMAGHIHGNPEQKEKDDAIRAKLLSLGYEVVPVPSFELDDKEAVVRKIGRIAKYLVGREKKREVTRNQAWFDRVLAEATEEEVQERDRPELLVIDGRLRHDEAAQRAADRASLSLRVVTPRPEERYATCVPLIPLKAAASGFGDAQYIDEDSGYEWVEVDATRRLQPGMFVAQVVGRSMEPLIPNGSWCLFRGRVAGTQQGRTVLVKLLDALDPETGEAFTVKRYESEKERVDDSWVHARIVLRPANPEFEPIVLDRADKDRLAVVAEFVEVVEAGQ
jgi:SOS-response transcriptional repressor LexA